MTKKPLVPEKEGELDKFKMEVAHELNLARDLDTGSIAEKIGTAGNVGGEMVRRMIEEGEKKLINKK
ncbi:MAG: alpha/beta-type small acid-soluble spore protein [Bacillota bacterium]|nr:alpha/beta-type small acid-soluble spore protein [Bacillota bacterium]